MQIQLVKEEKLFPRLVQYMKGPDFELRREAAWGLSNATSSGSGDQIRNLVEEGIIEPMCELLSSSDPKLIMVALDALDNILKNGEREAKDKTGINPYTHKVEACGGLDKIESLQMNGNATVYEKAVSVLENYFNAEDDQNVAPNILSSFQVGAVVASHFNF